MFGYTIIKKEKIEDLNKTIINLRNFINKHEKGLLTLSEIRELISRAHKDGKKPIKIIMGITDYFNFKSLYKDYFMFFTFKLVKKAKVISFEGIDVIPDRKIYGIYLKVE